MRLINLLSYKQFKVLKPKKLNRPIILIEVCLDIRKILLNTLLKTTDIFVNGVRVKDKESKL